MALFLGRREITVSCSRSAIIVMFGALGLGAEKGAKRKCCSSGQRTLDERREANDYRVFSEAT